MLTKGEGRIRNSTRVVRYRACWVSSLASQLSTPVVTNLVEQFPREHSQSCCAWSLQCPSALPTELSGAAALFPQTAWAYVPFLFFLRRNGALLSYCLKHLSPQSIPVLCELKPCEQPMSIFWINHLSFLLPIIRRAHRKQEVKDLQAYTTLSCYQIYVCRWKEEIITGLFPVNSNHWQMKYEHKSGYTGSHQRHACF